MTRDQLRSAGRAVAGVVGGYLTGALLSVETTLLLRKLWPVLGNAGQGPALESLDAAYALLYLTVGGFVACWISGPRTAAALGTIFAIISVITLIFRLDTAHSLAYQCVIALGCLPAAMLGAKMRTALTARRTLMTGFGGSRYDR